MEDPLKRWAARGYRKNDETSINPASMKKLDSALAAGGSKKAAAKAYCDAHDLEFSGQEPKQSGDKWTFLARPKGSTKPYNSFTAAL